MGYTTLNEKAKKHLHFTAIKERIKKRLKFICFYLLLPTNEYIIMDYTNKTQITMLDPLIEPTNQLSNYTIHDLCKLLSAIEKEIRMPLIMEILGYRKEEIGKILQLTVEEVEHRIEIGKKLIEGSHFF